jgi:hypothetical protein
MPPAQSIATNRNTITLDQLNMRCHSVLLCLPIPRLRRISARRMPMVGSGPEATDCINQLGSEPDRRI